MVNLRTINELKGSFTILSKDLCDFYESVGKPRDAWYILGYNYSQMTLAQDNESYFKNFSHYVEVYYRSDVDQEYYFSNLYKMLYSDATPYFKAIENLSKMNFGEENLRKGIVRELSSFKETLESDKFKRELNNDLIKILKKSKKVI